MISERGFDRLMAFSDAVVAIAVTLLVLPLVDLPGTITDGTDASTSTAASIGQVLSDVHNQLIAFGVSFVVILRLWFAHHRIFEHFRTADAATQLMNFAWLATIVVLPFPTALMSTPVADHGAVALYVAVLLVSTVLLQAMAWWVRHHLDLADEHDDAARAWLAARQDWATPASMMLALIIAIIVPSVGPWVMLMLFLAPVLELLRKAFTRRFRPGRRERETTPGH